jgi:hypothetical protein
VHYCGIKMALPAAVESIKLAAFVANKVLAVVKLKRWVQLAIHKHFTRLFSRNKFVFACSKLRCMNL